MYWNKWVFILIVAISNTTLAQEVEIATNAPETKDFSGHQTEEWLQVQGQLTNLKGRVENQQKIVESLIVKKEGLTGNELIETIEKLKKAHTEWIRLISLYNQVNNLFQTKFPEKGSSVGRIYKRIDPAKIEVLEEKMTLEGRLQKLDSTIKKQYLKTATSAKVPAIKNQELKKSNKKAAEAVVSSESQVTDQIILEK